MLNARKVYLEDAMQMKVFDYCYLQQASFLEFTTVLDLNPQSCPRAPPAPRHWPRTAQQPVSGEPPLPCSPARRPWAEKAMQLSPCRQNRDLAFYYFWAQGGNPLARAPAAQTGLSPCPQFAAGTPWYQETTS